jgi:hypothetical protein
MARKEISPVFFGYELFVFTGKWEGKILRKITRISLVGSEMKIWKSKSPKHKTFKLKYARKEFQQMNVM